MNRKIIIIAAALLLAAGCNKSKPAPVPQDNSTQQNSGSSGSDLPSGFTQNGITVVSPVPGDTVTSPISISGYGLPPFEGVSGSAEVLDLKGKVLGQAQLNGDSANPKEPYNFSGSVDFANPAGTGYVAITLRIKNDNASGSPQNDRSIDVPLQVNIPK